MGAPNYTEAERKKFKLDAMRRVWGLVLPIACPRCKVKATRRCVDLRKDHEGQLINWPHESRRDAAWAQLALNAQTTVNPEFDDLKDLS